MQRVACACVAVLLSGVACKPVPGPERDAGSAPDAGQDAGIDAGTDAGMDAGGDMASNVYPAFALDVPQVVDFGGPILANPEVVPVFFANDDFSTNGFVQKLTEFLNLVGGTAYWSGAVSEYGVGALSSMTPYVSSDKPKGGVSDADIQAWLTNELTTNPTFPQPTENTIYVLHYPAGVTITESSGGQSCEAFGGYHSDFALPPTSVVTVGPPDAGPAGDGGSSPDGGISSDAGDSADAGDSDAGDGGVTTFTTNPNGITYAVYAVLPRCSSFNGVTGIDAVTGPESHELVEASTDPEVGNRPAYAQVDDKHFAWEAAFGDGELGDMCEDNPGAYAKFTGLAFTVQRIWSNRNAKAGHDPCQPELPGEVYFNSMPVLKDKASSSFGFNETFDVESVNVPVGSSQSIQLELFSEADTTPIGGAWTVQVADLAQLETGQPDTVFTLLPMSGVNGNVLTLTVSPKKAGTDGADIFFVYSTLGSYTNLWVGTVGD